MKTYKIKDIGKVITGKTPSTKNNEYYNSKDYLFICPPDIKKTRYISHTEKFISKNAFESCSSINIPKNSILIDCIGADLGNVAISTEECISNQQINSIIQINRTIADPLYLYYYFSTKKSFFHRIGQNGSTMPIINKTMFENIEILIHNPHEQQHIVNTIGTIDDLIEQKQKILAVLERNSTLLYRQYKLMQQNNPVLSLGNCCEIRTGKLNANAANQNGEYPFFSCGQDELSINTYAFDEKAIIISGNGEISVKFYSGKFNAYQRTYVLTPEKYFYLFLKECEESIDDLKNNSQGSVIRFLTKGMLEKISIPIGASAKKINSDIENIYTWISSIKKELKQLQKLKEQLLKKYF